MMKKILSHTWLVLVALFMYVPVLILAFYSFTESTAIGAVRGFSLQNYVTLFTMEELRDMIVGTLALAVETISCRNSSVTFSPSMCVERYFTCSAN